MPRYEHPSHRIERERAKRNKVIDRVLKALDSADKQWEEFSREELDFFEEVKKKLKNMKGFV